MGANILLVEDHPTIVRLVQMLFTKTDYVLTVATNGSVAREMLSKTRFDAVILDAALPGANGFELTGYIRSNAGTSGMPVMMVTGFASVGDEKRAMDAGCDDFMQKPFNNGEFLQRVAALVARGGKE